MRVRQSSFLWVNKIHKHARPGLLEKRSSIRCSANGMPLTFRSRNVMNAGCVGARAHTHDQFVREWASLSIHNCRAPKFALPCRAHNETPKSAVHAVHLRTRHARTPCTHRRSREHKSYWRRERGRCQHKQPRPHRYLSWHTERHTQNAQEEDGERMPSRGSKNKT